MENGGDLHLTELEATSSKGCPVVFDKIFKFRQYIFTFLGKGRGRSFEETWVSFTQVCFVSCLVEIDLVVEASLWKVYDDDGQQTKCDQKSSLDSSDQKTKRQWVRTIRKTALTRSVLKLKAIHEYLNSDLSKADLNATVHCIEMRVGP